MPYLVKMQTKQNNKQQTLNSLSIGKGLGASILCLSVLAGCASNPEQEQPIEQVESASTSPLQSTPLKATEQEATEVEIVETPESPDETIQETMSDTAESASPETMPTQAEAAIQDNATAEPLVESTAAIATSAETSQAITTTDNTPEQALGEATTTAEVASISDQTSIAEVATASESTIIAEVPDAADVPAIAEESAMALALGEEAVTEAPSSQAITRSNKNLGKSYGIWKLKEAGNGFCKLKTPTLQIGNKEYSSQIWMDIEEHQVVVNAYMPLDINHPKTGIQIDNQALVPFTEQANSTRAIITADMTSQLASGKVLHVLINGKEIGNKVLKRNVKLTDMNAAITALRSCSK